MAPPCSRSPYQQGPQLGGRHGQAQPQQRQPQGQHQHQKGQKLGGQGAFEKAKQFVRFLGLAPGFGL
jgi:hypothetical protein